MTLPRLICASLLLAACTPPEKSLGEGEAGDDAGTTAGDESPASDDIAHGDDGATSMSSVDGGSSAGECEGQPIPPCDPLECDPGCGVGSACVDGAWNCECQCDDSGGSTGTPADDDGSGDTGFGACEIVETACEMADGSVSPPVDCGDIGFDDPEADWLAAHDCSVDAIAQGQGFKVIFDMQGIDSLPRRAFVGLPGVVYALTQLDQDIGGLAPDPSPIMVRDCDEVVATPGCTPTVGEICLECMGQAGSDVLCEG